MRYARVSVVCDEQKTRRTGLVDVRDVGVEKPRVVELGQAHGHVDLARCKRRRTRHEVEDQVEVFGVE